MRRRTILHTGLGLLLSATVTLTGCTIPRDHAGTGGPPSPSPAEQLARAAARLQQDTYTMTMTMTIDGQHGQLTGSMDPAKKMGAFTITVPRPGSRSRTVTQERIIGDTLYLTVPDVGLPGTTGKPWRRINLKADTTGPAWSDGAQMATGLQKATDVRQVADNTYRGTLDVAASATALGVPAPTASSGKARIIPFEAHVQGGRLVRYSFDLPTSEGPTNNATVVFSDFGAPVTVHAPPADQIRN